MADLEVRTDTGRDLLQSAAVFKNERMVVWEYVANSLQYVDPGTSPIVNVTLDSRARTIVIEDNGAGMDLEGLKHFFTMHGENQERKQGRAGRGLFGTGKSAAFGIGGNLHIVTVRNGKRSTVELSRDEVKKIKPPDPIPVQTIEQEVGTDEPNGTTITISGIGIKTLGQGAVVTNIERHIAGMPNDIAVFVNKHRCEYHEPPVEKVHMFEPTEEEAALIGKIKLKIKVSKMPLTKEQRGVVISSNGVWHESTLLDADGKTMSDYIFGEVDIPALDTDTSLPPAFDLSRSMDLNRDNAVVKAIYEFVGPRIQEVLDELQADYKNRKSEEDAKRLSKEAEKIEEIINSDFEGFRNQLKKVRAESGQGFDTGSEGGGEGEEGEGDDFIFGGDEPGKVVDETGGAGTDGTGDGGSDEKPRRLNPTAESDPEGDAVGEQAKTAKKPRPRGGFSIDFGYHGEESARATYAAESRTIFINLDHPQIKNALSGRSPEDPVFRRLAYEVAFSEYAIALASELDNRGVYIEPSDAIGEIRGAVNRIARSAAQLYID